jgi:excinuclease ABC subunit A
MSLKKADKAIVIQRARVHNLKNISLRIPLNQFIVVTGVSGSGKSSLAFDTLFAEGQRRYVESLSSYARQFLGRINKPEVDYIKGHSAGNSHRTKVNTRNPRSTVGTSTEIYDYMKLLYARIGKTISPVSGKEVSRHSVTDVVDSILSYPENTRVMILSPLKLNKGRTLAQEAELLMQKGFSRLEKDEEVVRIDEMLADSEKIFCNGSCNVVIDRVVVQRDEDTQSRMADSVQTAFFEGHGECVVKIIEQIKKPKSVFPISLKPTGFYLKNPLCTCSALTIRWVPAQHARVTEK